MCVSQRCFRSSIPGRAIGPSPWTGIAENTARLVLAMHSDNQRMREPSSPRLQCGSPVVRGDPRRIPNTSIPVRSRGRRGVGSVHPSVGAGTLSTRNLSHRSLSATRQDSVPDYRDCERARSIRKGSQGNVASSCPEVIEDRESIHPGWRESRDREQSQKIDKSESNRIPATIIHWHNAWAVQLVNRPAGSPKLTGLFLT